MSEIAQDYVLLGGGTAPPTPPAGQVALYRGSDGKTYVKKSDGSTTSPDDAGGVHPDLAAHVALGLGASSPPVVKTQRLLIHSPLISASPWTNMPLALSMFMGTATAAKHVQKINLTGFTQVRLLVFKSTTAGAAASKLILRYRTTFSQTATDFSDIGTSEVSVAVNVQNSFLDTGYINLAAGAKAEVFVALLGSGGDGTLDPAFGIIEAEFK